MLKITDFEKIERNKIWFYLFIILTVIFISGSTFTSVIPYLKDFSLFLFIFGIGIYFLMGNLLVGLITNKPSIILILSLALSSLGMGWRLWLEWGEFSLIEHTRTIVLIGYPCIISFIITTAYIICSKSKTQKDVDVLN